MHQNVAMSFCNAKEFYIHKIIRYLYRNG